MQLNGSDPKKIFGQDLWELEACEKNFRANMYDAQGALYYALVKAAHFPAAYSKAKRTARDQGFSLGRIRQV